MVIACWAHLDPTFDNIVIYTLACFAQLKTVELNIDVNRHEPTILVRPCMLLLSTQ